MRVKNSLNKDMLLYMIKLILGLDSIIRINLNFNRLIKLIIFEYILYTTKLFNL